jgi:LEA14-like dessication related protein
MDIPIEVVNPNYFSVKLTHVDAQLFYRINNTLIGNGTIHNVVLPSSSTTNFTFPFALVYTKSIDPTSTIITDIASKCLSSPPSDLTINYKITVGVRVFMVTISPTISNSLSFACPIDSASLQALIKNLGLSSLSDLAGSGSHTGS